ncbi:G1/S-specific cyclin-E2-like [Paramormyrops kingsleyae]|uniref:Cyclin E2 n=1 Tax=Paramormyrops kingsleyae TaxID=1676925 RepID=A0A3B3RMH7_9TELE|nr:G1/S-specific cyclin-E2-like [Paramormyrops kingsleyae]XP_023648788.1 G1/S-specific cyclin-E2-like [Paramormyrops kingsleyae]
MSRRSARLIAKGRNEAIQKVTRTRKRLLQCDRRQTGPATAETELFKIKGRCSTVNDLLPILTETPHKELEVSRYLSEVRNLSTSPLPCLSWASSEDVWIKMLNKDVKYVHDKSFVQRHPGLHPRMRSILLDWLMEVSEEHTLQRETFYLAQDLFDRFMLTQEAVDKTRLQLIGVTALFIASKLEEIYPPRLEELAYFTDGTCFEKEIQQMELILLKALNWEIRPETVISWLKLYVQVSSLKDDHRLLVPQFSPDTYVRITQLLDLCILDINSLGYQYGVLAAAALSHFTSFDVAQNASGLRPDVLADCVSWMLPFMRTVSESRGTRLKGFPTRSQEDGYNIQTHTDYLAMLRDVQKMQLETVSGLSPGAESTTLTPPKSAEKRSPH